MHTRLIDLYERLRANLWFLPVVMSLMAAALAWVLVFADEARLGYGLLGGLRFMGLPPEGARTILQTIATGMITVASLVFSLTFIALTLLSQQLGPRLLLIFMQDRTTQLTLGVFVAGFIHSLLVMGATGTGEGQDFVPYLAVMAAIVIAIGAFLVMIYFLHHIALFVQADHTLAVIAKELDARIDDLVERGREAAEARGDGPRPTVGEERGQFDGKGTPVAAGRDGYIYLFDFDALIACARKHDLKVLLDCRPGDFLVTGQPMMRAIGLPHDEGEESGGIVEALRGAVTLGSARRPAEDIEFEIAALLEVALRALSTGINDPYTASAAIDHLAAGLCRIARNPIRIGSRADEEGVPRLWQMPRRLIHYFDSAFQPLRGSIRGKAQVTRRLIHRIAVLIDCLRHRDSAEGVAAFLETLRRDIEEGMENPRDREQLLGELDEVLDRLERRKQELPE
jgi:uncharacterized membrane protein